MIKNDVGDLSKKVLFFLVVPCSVSHKSSKSDFEPRQHRKQGTTSKGSGLSDSKRCKCTTGRPKTLRATPRFLSTGPRARLAGQPSCASLHRRTVSQSVSHCGSCEDVGRFVCVWVRSKRSAYSFLSIEFISISSTCDHHPESEELPKTTCTSYSLMLLLQAMYKP